MKPFPRPELAPRARRGAALMLSFMVLLVLILILAQIQFSTNTTARVARNEETIALMDAAIESSLLQVFEDLKTDAESDTGGAGGEAGGGMPGGAAAGGEEGGGESGPTDSKEDEWSRAQRTEFGDIQLRILIQDEDSKFNALSILTADEDEAEKALDRLARVIEWSRKGTPAEIDPGTARRMATAMHDFMRRRADQVLPRPQLLSDLEGDEDVGLPLSLREFVAIEPELFPRDMFRDYIDEESEQIVHSLGSFLTVWSSVGTADEAREAAQEASGEAAPPGDNEEDEGGGDPEDEGGGEGDGEGDDSGGGGGGGGEGGPEQGGGEGGAGGGGGESEPPPGWAINVNTAPGAVLHALADARDVPYRFWDEVVLYRNEKDETVEENEDPPLDEYGEPIVVKQFFRSVEDLSKVDGWEGLEPIVQGELQGLLKTQSQVFSIFITARKPTGEEQIEPFSRREDVEREEANWQGLVRTVRAVVWRRQVGEGEVEIVPIVRWEVIDYVPFEVRDVDERRSYR